MSWPKTVIAPRAKPAEPKIRYWFVFLLVVLLITLVAIFLLKPQHPTREDVISYLTILAVEFLVWALFCSFRIFWYGVLLEYGEAWQREQEKADVRWNEWAARHLVILDSCLFSPIADDASALLERPQRLSVNTNQAIALRLDAQDERGNRQRQAIADVLSSLYQTLVALPVGQKIAVDIFCSSGDTSDSAMADFSDAWEPLKLTCRTEVNVNTSSELSMLEDGITSSDSDVKMVIVLQLESLRDNAAFTSSEFVAAFLFTGESLAKSLKLEPKAKLLRPMFSTEEELYDDLYQMHDIQRDMATARHVWFTGFQGKRTSSLIGRLSELEMDLRHEQESSGVHDIDLYHGLPGKLNGWLAIALAADAASKTKDAHLAAASVYENVSLALVKPHLTATA